MAKEFENFNKVVINQTTHYQMGGEKEITNFLDYGLAKELKLKQNQINSIYQQLAVKVAVKASLMHKSQLTKTIIDEVIETHKIIGVEPHQKYLIVEIENTTNDKVFSVKVDIPLAQAIVYTIGYIGFLAPGGTYKEVSYALYSNGKPVIMVNDAGDKTIYECLDERKLNDISGKELGSLLGNVLYSEIMLQPSNPQLDKCVIWNYYKGFIIP